MIICGIVINYVLAYFYFFKEHAMFKRWIL